MGVIGWVAVSWAVIGSIYFMSWIHRINQSTQRSRERIYQIETFLAMEQQWRERMGQALPTSIQPKVHHEIED